MPLRRSSSRCPRRRGRSRQPSLIDQDAQREALDTDLRDLDQRPARARGVSFHARHVDLPDDDAHGSSLGPSILQAWKVDLPMDDGSSCTHGRSPLHACQDTGRHNDRHSSMSGRSSHPTSRIGPDRFGDRHGYSGSSNLVASLVARIACRLGIEASMSGQRRLVARTAKAHLHDNEASMPADQGWRATREASMPCRSTTRVPIALAWKSRPRTAGSSTPQA